MHTYKIMAFVQLELKKLYRAPMNLAVLILMPVGLTLILFIALGGVANEGGFYPVPGMNHFEYLIRITSLNFVDTNFFSSFFQ